MMKYNIPSFSQKVGRTIQTTPANIHNSPTFMASKPKLDEMYEILERYKYPLLKNISTMGFISGGSFSIDAGNLFSVFQQEGSVVIDINFVETNMLTPFLSQLTNPPPGKIWNWGISNINFHCRQSELSNNSLFTLIWDGPFLITPEGVPINKNLVTKSLGTTFTPPFQTAIICVPGPTNGQCKTNIVAFTATNITNSLSQSNCIDPNFNDNGYYFLMTNDSNQLTFDQKITFNVTNTSNIQYFNFTFNFIFYLT